jgi:hypothetical protein
MLVGTDDGAIDERPLPIELVGGIGLLLHCVKQMLEDASLTPAVEAARHRPPGAVALRQVVPGSAGAEHPQHPVEDAAMVDGWSSRLGFLRWKQRLEPLPWGIGQVASVHSTHDDIECV